jgi:hypothetical protein
VDSLFFSRITYTNLDFFNMPPLEICRPEPVRKYGPDAIDSHSFRLEIFEPSGRLYSPVALPPTTQLEASYYSSGFSSEYKMTMHVFLHLFSAELSNSAGKLVAWLFCTHVFWVT